MTIIYLLAAFQALFLVSLLLTKNNKSTADKVLTAWLAAIAIHTLIYFVYFQFQAWVPLLMNLNAILPFLQGPFLLAYVVTLIGMRERFTGTDYLHLLPAAGFFVYLVFSEGAGILSISSSGHSRFVSLFTMSGFFVGLMLISVPVYIAWSLVLMRKASCALESSAKPARFRWVWVFVAGLGVIWAMALLAFFLIQSKGHQTAPHLVFWALTLFVYGLGYMGLTRTSVFTKPEFEVLKQKLQPKYRKSGLKTGEARAVHRRMIKYVDKEQAYLDGELSLRSLAQELGLSTNHLSQVINEFEQCNFHDFINQRRIRMACERIRQSRDINMLELAMEVGFNSKSSFNRAFLKFTGGTPTDFAQKSGNP